MAYTPTVWKNREVERPRTYQLQDNGDGTTTLIPAEGNVIEAGTPIIADNMNKIEQGIKEAHDQLDSIASDISDIRADIGDKSQLQTNDKSNLVAAVNELFTSVGSGKALIAAAITDKGVPTSPTDTFATMAANIGAIETGLDSFFGDGSDGDFNSTGNVTFPVTAHSGLVVKQYRSFRLNAGHTMTVDNPCRGLIIYVQEDCIIDGIIDMSQKACLAPNGEPLPMVITKDLDKYYRLTTVLQSLRGGAGGNGGYGGGYNNAFRQTSVGIGGQGRQCLGGFGGGGSGGSAVRGSGDSGYFGGIGGSIEYAELGGGDGTNTIINANATSGVQAQGINAYNGAGGSGAINMDGGAGNLFRKGGKCNGGGGGGGGGSGKTLGAQGGDGQFAGGFICLIVGGNLSISGSLKANGGNGGNGGAGGAINATWPTGGGGGGGGSGGGVIAIFHRGTYTNYGSIQVNGGNGGAGGSGAWEVGEPGGPGQSGSVGSIHIEQIA
ncbi:MAG: hypothetical protein BAA01_11590 [Bacillus thermozeamaize]|uniref:Tail fiber protein n=1 Tax=Bacillus thermozeamaize TaxID=230954 RepID=A0A1Y3PHQ1_9BACI|nr:MAG: hypothetical protein BAA01_11590 [Bacillus thermozeamaize]